MIFISFDCYAGVYHQKVIISQAGYYYTYADSKDSISKYSQSLYVDQQTNLLPSFELKSDKPNCNLGTPYLTPNVRIMAISGHCSIKYSKEPYEIHYYLLTLADVKTHKIIASLDHADIFSFSPTGDSIAYAEDILGERGSPAPPGYQGGLWIYNLNTKTKTKINTLKTACKDINWSPHDGNIYVQGYNRVFRYNVAKGTGEIVPYKGIYFSADGKYYSSTSTEDSWATIYRTCDNKEMKEWLNTILSQDSRKGYFRDFEFWSKKLNAVVFRLSDQSKVIFDVGSGKVIGKFSGDVMGINPDGSLVAVHPLKRPETKQTDPTKVEILSLVELTSKYQSKK